MSGGGGGQRAGTGGPRWPVASRRSPVLFVGSGPALSAFSSPSPLGSDTGETAAELEGRARRELGLSGSAWLLLHLVTHLWLCFQVSLKAGALTQPLI